MGKPRWDSVYAQDSTISKSVPRLKFSKDLYILHREIEVSRHTAHRLARALTSEKHFEKMVPHFLRKCHVEGDRYLLATIAALIEKGKVAASPAWRFNVVPIPHSALRRGVVYHLEIRFVCELQGLIPPAKIPAVRRGLRQANGFINARFRHAVSALMAAMKARPALYPGGRAVLAEMFDVPPHAAKQVKKRRS